MYTCTYSQLSSAYPLVFHLILHVDSSTMTLGIPGPSKVLIPVYSQPFLKSFYFLDTSQRIISWVISKWIARISILVYLSSTTWRWWVIKWLAIFLKFYWQGTEPTWSHNIKQKASRFSLHKTHVACVSPLKYMSQIATLKTATWPVSGGTHL